MHTETTILATLYVYHVNYFSPISYKQDSFFLFFLWGKLSHFCIFVRGIKNDFVDLSNGHAQKSDRIIFGQQSGPD